MDKEAQIVKEMEEASKHPNFLYENVKVCEGCYKIYDIIRTLHLRNQQINDPMKQHTQLYSQNQIQESKSPKQELSKQNYIKGYNVEEERNRSKKKFPRDRDYKRKGLSPLEGWSTDGKFSYQISQLASNQTISHSNSPGRNSPKRGLINEKKVEKNFQVNKSQGAKKQEVIDQRYIRTPIGQIDKNNIDDLLLDMQVRLQEIDISLQYKNKPQVAKEEIKKMNSMIMKDRKLKQEKEQEKEMKQERQKNQIEKILNSNIIPQDEVQERPKYTQILGSSEQKIPKNMVQNSFLSKEEYNDRIQNLRVQKYSYRKRNKISAR